jgi:excisionase family DNA binding protein
MDKYMERMTKSERLAYLWLCDKFDYSDIIYSHYHTPKFTIADHAYDAKIARGRTVVYSQHQLMELESGLPVTVLVYATTGDDNLSSHSPVPDAQVFIDKWPESGVLMSAGYRVMATGYSHPRARLSDNRISLIVNKQVKYCSIKEAAHILNVSDESVRRYIQSGKLKSMRVDTRWWVDVGDLFDKNPSARIYGGKV